MCVCVWWWEWWWRQRLASATWVLAAWSQARSCSTMRSVVFLNSNLRKDFCEAEEFGLLMDLMLVVRPRWVVRSRGSNSNCRSLLALSSGPSKANTKDLTWATMSPIPAVSCGGRGFSESDWTALRILLRVWTRKATRLRGKQVEAEGNRLSSEIRFQVFVRLGISNTLHQIKARGFLMEEMGDLARRSSRKEWILSAREASLVGEGSRSPRAAMVEFVSAGDKGQGAAEGAAETGNRVFELTESRAAGLQEGNCRFRTLLQTILKKRIQKKQR